MARRSCDCHCTFRYGWFLAETITCLDGHSLAVKLKLRYVVGVKEFNTYYC
jgi:hypothetical protein